MLLPTRRRDRRSDRLLPDGIVVPLGGQCGHAPQGSRLDRRACGAVRGVGARARDLADARGAGARTRAHKTASLLSRGASRHGARHRTIFRGRDRCLVSSRAPDTPARMDSRSCCRTGTPPRRGGRWSRRASTPAGLGARDTLRLEAGMNLYGNDMDETHHPLESGLAWTVAFEPEERDFIGRARSRSARARRRRRARRPGARGARRAAQPSGRERRRGAARGAPRRALGEVTSGTFSPTLNRSIALARVRRDVRRAGAGRHSRQAACGAHRQAAVRAQRQSVDRHLSQRGD